MVAGTKFKARFQLKQLAIVDLAGENETRYMKIYLYY